MSGLYGHKGPSDGGEDEFDVVVVGAGSAGCALAGRLTEDPTLRVLLLEAGGSDDVLEVQVPAGLYKTWRTRLDWNYTTEPQPGLDGRKLFWPRGKLLGGSSSINSVITFASVPALPFGGVGDSGFGRIHGEDGLKEFTRAKAITRQRVALPVNLMSFSRPASATDAVARVMGMIHGRHR